MIKVSKRQIINRWDALSDNLKDFLFAQENSDVLWRICESQHLSNDKIQKIAILVGNIILGFTHPYDLAQEIRSELGLNQIIADAIAAEVDRKIFSQIRGELEKVYSPATEEKEEAEVLDLRKKTETPLKTGEKLIETDRNLIETETGAEKAELPELIITDTDKHGLENGLTRITEATKIIPAEQKPEVKKEMEEGPMIIHKEAEFKSSGDGKKSSLGGFFGFLKNGKTEQAKPSAVRAEVKMDSVEADKRGFQNIIEADSRGKAKISAEQPAQPRVVHYSEFSTPITPIKAVEKNEPKKIEPIEPPENLPAVIEKPINIVKPPQINIPKPPAAIPVPKKSSSFWDFLKFKKSVKPAVKPENKPEVKSEIKSESPKPNMNLVKPNDDMIDLNVFK